MKRWLALSALALCSFSGALTLSGTVGPDVPPDARVGLFLVGPTGTPLGEFASAAVNAGRFTLELPDTPPAASAQFPLRRENIAWPGVFEPVTLSREVMAGELRAYVYSDSNGSGRFESGEALAETPLHVGRDAVVLVWLQNDLRLQAARGFDASLRRGWNALSISAGKTVKVSPYSGGSLNLIVTR